MKLKDEMPFEEYRTKRVILEMYNAMQMVIETGEAHRTRLVPGLADRAVAHEGRVGEEVRAFIEERN